MMNGMELIFQPGAQAIFDHVAALHGLRIAFFAPDGSELRAGQSRGNCTYCQLLCDTLGYGETCRALDYSRRMQAAEAAHVVAYECHGGMTEAILAARRSGRLLGFVMIGQFRSRATLPRSIRIRAKRKKTESALTKAFFATPCMTPVRVQSLLGLFQVLVQFITEHRMIDIHDTLDPLIARLRDNPEERLSLSHAAVMAGCSPTTLSRLIKRKLGRSYQSLKRDLALEKAEALFRASPALRISDVAYQLGFEDPLYFSRLYRRHRGSSPSEARRRLASSPVYAPPGTSERCKYPKSSCLSASK